MKRLLTFLIMAALAFQATAQGAKPKASSFFTTGEAFAPFRVRDINGVKIDAAAWSGKTVVINFWFIGCPPCRKEIPELNRLVQKYRNNPNVLFIGIALDDTREVREFAKENPFTYHLVGDGRALALEKFRINTYPTNLVINKAGKVSFHSSGLLPNTPAWIDRSIADSETGR